MRHTNRALTHIYAEGVARDQIDVRADKSIGPDAFKKIVDSVALRSDCADAYADLKLHYPHLFECPFSRDPSQMTTREPDPLHVYIWQWNEQSVYEDEELSNMVPLLVTQNRTHIVVRYKDGLQFWNKGSEG